MTGSLNTPPWLRISAAASVAVHLAALAVLLLFTDVRSYEAVAPDSIAVDLVAAEDVKPLQPDPPPAPKPADPQPTPEPLPQQQVQPSPPQPPQQQAQQPPSPQSPAKPAPRPEPKPAKQAAAPTPPSAPPQPAIPPPVPQPPDITEKYHVLLGLPAIGSDDGGGEAAERAKLAVSDIDRLRAHLRSCSALPSGVVPTDKVRIVMRIWLSPDRQLSRPPALVEASPSVKGPALMQAAIKALQDCAPYAMLPADKYQDWKSLDISFTPQDFPG